MSTLSNLLCMSCVRALDECPPLAERRLNPYTFVISCLIKFIKIPVTLSDTISSQCNRSKIASCQTEISLRWQCPQTSQSLFAEHLMQTNMFFKHLSPQFQSDCFCVFRGLNGAGNLLYLDRFFYYFIII